MESKINACNGLFSSPDGAGIFVMICSNTSSIPEVGKDLLDYFNPYDITDMKVKIEQALENKKTFEDPIIKNWLKRYNWSKTSKQTMEELKRIYEKNMAHFFKLQMVI